MVNQTTLPALQSNILQTLCIPYSGTIIMKLDAYDFKQANFFRILLVYLHHIVVSKTTLGCTAAYNANTHAVFHTGKFSNKTS